MPGTPSENHLSRMVQAAIAARLAPLVVRCEVPLYTTPTCAFGNGKVAWPGDPLGLVDPWKQDICVGRTVDADNNDYFGFIPHVTIEAKKSYNTDGMLTAFEKLARLKRVYPFMQAIFLKYNDIDWGPTKKAWPLLREFDAYVPLRFYAPEDAPVTLHPDDLDRLVEVILELDASARFIGEKLAQDYESNGWVRVTKDLRDVAPDTAPAVPVPDLDDDP